MQIKRIIAAIWITTLLTVTAFLPSIQVVAGTTEEAFYSILFIIDVSGSMNIQDPEGLVAETIKMLLDTLYAPNSEVGFIAFNDAIVQEFPLTLISEPDVREEIKVAVSELPVSGSTDIGYALRHGVNMMTELQERQNRQPIIILFSDGETHLRYSQRGRSYEDSFADEAYALDMATRINAPIHTIGISSDGTLNTDYLMYISNTTQGRHYVIRGTHALPLIFGDLKMEAFESYTRQNTMITSESGWQHIIIDTLGYYADEVNIILHYDVDTVQYVIVFHDYYDIYDSNHFTSIRLKNPSVNEVILSLYSPIGNVIHNTVVNHIPPMPPPPPPNVPPIFLGETNNITFELRHVEESLFNLMDFFYDEDGDPLTFEIVNTDDNAFEMTIQESGLLSVVPASTRGEFIIIADDGQGGTARAVFVFTVPFLVFYRNHVVAVAIVFILLLLIFLLLLMSAKKKEIPEDVSPLAKFSGSRFEGYFLTTFSGNEFPVLNWNASLVENKHITSLGELFLMMGVDENLPEASKIYLEAGNNDALVFYHDTRCIVTIGNKDVPQNKKVVLRYNERFYITFEDHVTEIEIRYKKVKKI